MPDRIRRERLTVLIQSREPGQPGVHPGPERLPKGLRRLYAGAREKEVAANPDIKPGYGPYEVAGDVDKIGGG
jgi:hypothetical protein